MQAFRPTPLLRLRASPLALSGSTPRAPPPPSGSASRAKAVAPSQPTPTPAPAPQPVQQPFKQGTNKTLWESWKSLSPRIRKRVGLVFVGISIAGIVATDYWEDIMPVDSSVKPKETQMPLPEEHKPKLFGVRVVERN